MLAPSSRAFNFLFPRFSLLVLLLSSARPPFSQCPTQGSQRAARCRASFFPRVLLSFLLQRCVSNRFAFFFFLRRERRPGTRIDTRRFTACLSIVLLHRGSPPRAVAVVVATPLPLQHERRRSARWRRCKRQQSCAFCWLVCFRLGTGGPRRERLKIRATNNNSNNNSTQ